MLYWFFVKGLGPIAIHRLGPTAQGLENIPHEGGAIIAANHLAVIDDALLPLTCPRMIHFMGKAEYFEGKGIKGKGGAAARLLETDPNKDGKVSFDEIAAAKPGFPREAFDKADTNKDGVVSSDDVIKK